MRTSFLDYSMSVIVSRALPDARDGLKPVHRRVLYAMNELGLQPNRERIKCARVVGDVMGKYHPHGNQAIYDALVRMAQPFSLRYPLVDPQGNFGNVDGYPAAAERYTEARLAAMAAELLRDIDQDTIDFIPNYDGSEREPAVLPARFPNLLVNGATGIAVGMATNIPPHNLSETIDAVIAMIDDADIDVERLSQHIKGPDFPTGGIILGREGIREAYRSGRGRIRVRGRAHIEELRGGKAAIIVSELPYGVKKGGDDGVISKIADLVREGVLSEVAAHRDGVKDLSGKDGMRIYIELKRDAVPQVALNKLYQHTSLQTTFGYNAVALVDGVPRTLSLLELIRTLPRPPARGRHPAAEVRAAQRGPPRAHPRGLPDRARQHRRGHRADPRLREHRGCPPGSDARVRPQRAAGKRDPRDAPPRPDRARAQAPAERVRRPDGADRRAPRDPVRRIADRRRHPRGAARGQGDLRSPRRAPHRDHRGRGRPRARGSDRGRGHGDRDHALRLHQAAFAHGLQGTAPRRRRRDGDGHEGRGLHRAPLRRLDARLHPLLHLRRQGLPPQGARAPARLAPGEGPDDRQPAPGPPGRAGARGDQDAQLRGDRVPPLRDQERRRQEDQARRLQHAAQGRRDHRDQDARRRRARLRAAVLDRRRRPARVAQGPGDPLLGGGRARDGTRNRGRARA